MAALAIDFFAAALGFFGVVAAERDFVGAVFVFVLVEGRGFFVAALVVLAVDFFAEVLAVWVASFFVVTLTALAAGFFVAGANGFFAAAVTTGLLSFQRQRCIQA